jgi:cytochrome P450
VASSEVFYNPLMPEFHANPYPFYRRLREEDPVHASPLGIWVLTRYDDAVMVLRDPRFGREGIAELAEARLGAARARPTNTRDMLFRDPPDHTRLRSLVSRAFTPRSVEAMRPHIQEIVDGLLDRQEGARGMDVIEDLAYPLPVRVICEMLGVPIADQEIFRQWSADIARSLDAALLPAGSDVVTRGQESSDALKEYFRSLIALRRKDPQPDLLSALIAAEEQGDKLS